MSMTCTRLSVWDPLDVPTTALITKATLPVRPSGTGPMGPTDGALGPVPPSPHPIINVESAKHQKLMADRDPVVRVERLMLPPGRVLFHRSRGAMLTASTAGRVERGGIEGSPSKPAEEARTPRRSATTCLSPPTGNPRRS